MRVGVFTNNETAVLCESLRRYFKYCLEHDLELIIVETKEPAFGLDIIFLLNEVKILEECCGWIYNQKIKSEKLRIIGYDYYSDINLILLETLKQKFKKSFQVEKGIQLIQIPFFSDHIKLFFKGHGEQSLLGCLGWVNYYIGNYPNLAASGDYSPMDLNKIYLAPGIQNWQEFIQRFNKYAPIIYAAGWANEVNAIERLLKTISVDLKQVALSDSFYTFETESLTGLSEITALLEEIASQAEQTYDKTNTTDYR